MGAVMVRSISGRLASISSELPASFKLLGEVMEITWAASCKGLSLRTLQTFSTSSGFPSDNTSSHSAKLISSTFVVFTRSAARSAGGGGTYCVMGNPAGGVALVEDLACATTSLQP